MSYDTSVIFRANDLFELFVVLQGEAGTGEGGSGDGVSSCFFNVF